MEGSKPHSKQHRRLQLVTAYARDPSYKRVALRYNTTPTTVKLWVERAKAGCSLLDAPRSGRPALGVEQAASMHVLMKGVSQRKTLMQLVQDLKAEAGLDVSKETVRRTVAKVAKQLRPKKRPVLTTKHRQSRLQFARQNRGRNRKWSLVVFTDSKIFWLHPRGIGPKVWVLHGEAPPTAPKFANTHKVHVYAGVSKWGKTPLFITSGTTGLKDHEGKAIKGGVNGEVYKKLLADKLLPACRDLMAGHVQCGEKWVFQQDGAPAHTAGHVQTFLQQQQDFDLMEWPANSPDLSWIENIWALVSNRLNRRDNVTAQNFREAIFEEWDQVTNDDLMKSYLSMPKRMTTCIKAQGGHTGY